MALANCGIRVFSGGYLDVLGKPMYAVCYCPQLLFHILLMQAPPSVKSKPEPS